MREIDWKMIRLRDLTTKIGSGTTPRGGSKVYQEKGIPLVRSQNVHPNEFRTEGLVFISDEQHEKMKSTQLQPSDVLLNITGASIGRSCLVPESLGEANVNQHVCIVRCNEKILPAYLCSYLNSDDGQKLIFSYQAGGNREGLNFDQISRFKIPVPPLPEQKRIATILSTWDRAIELTDRLIEACERRKRGLMEGLLGGRMRFEQFISSPRTFPTRYGEYPIDWKYVRLGEIADQISETNTNGHNHRVLSCTKHEGLVDSLSYFGKQVFSNDLTPYKIVRNKHFAYATNHIEEGSIGYQNICDIAVISPIYTVFKTRGEVDDSFLFKLLKSNTYIHIYQTNTSASVDRRGSLRWREFSKIWIPLPSLEEQKAIAQTIDDQQHEIKLLKAKINILNHQKKALMHQLLTSNTGAMSVEVMGRPG